MAENLYRAESGVYYLVARIRGKLVERSLKTRNKEAARIARDALLRSLREKKDPAFGEAHTMGDVVRAVAYKRSQRPGLKQASVEHWPYIAASICRAPQASIIVRDVKPDDLAELWRWFIGAYSAKYSNKALSLIKASAVALGVEVPDDVQPVKVRRVIREVLTNDQLQAVLVDIRAQGKRASDEAADLIAFLAFSGCRLREALAVRWGDIGSDLIKVTGGEVGTKNMEERIVPIIEPMRDLLWSMARGGAGELVFTLKGTEALRNSTRRLGFPAQRLHDLRHYFITLCVESGVDIPTIAMWVGHRDGGALLLRTYSHLRSGFSMAQAAKVSLRSSQ